MEGLALVEKAGKTIQAKVAPRITQQIEALPWSFLHAEVPVLININDSLETVFEKSSEQESTMKLIQSAQQNESRKQEGLETISEESEDPERMILNLIKRDKNDLTEEYLRKFFEEFKESVKEKAL